MITPEPVTITGRAPSDCVMSCTNGIYCNTYAYTPTPAKPSPPQKQRCPISLDKYAAVWAPGLIPGTNPHLFCILSDILSGLNAIIA